MGKKPKLPPRENTMTRISNDQLVELGILAKECRLTRLDLLNAIIHEKFERFLEGRKTNAPTAV
jgi:hypothetical protein